MHLRCVFGQDQAQNGVHWKRSPWKSSRLRIVNQDGMLQRRISHKLLDPTASCFGPTVPQPICGCGTVTPPAPILTSNFPTSELTFWPSLNLLSVEAFR